MVLGFDLPSNYGDLPSNVAGSYSLDLVVAGMMKWRLSKAHGSPRDSLNDSSKQENLVETHAIANHYDGALNVRYPTGLKRQ